MQGAGCWLRLQPRLARGAGRGWYCNVWQVPRSWLCTTHFLQALQTHGGIAQCPVNSSSTHFRPSAGKPCCPSTYHVSTDKPLPDICVAGAYCNGYLPNGTCVMVGGGVGFGGDSALNLFVALYVTPGLSAKCQSHGETLHHSNLAVLLLLPPVEPLRLRSGGQAMLRADNACDHCLCLPVGHRGCMGAELLGAVWLYKQAHTPL